MQSYTQRQAQAYRLQEVLQERAKNSGGFIPEDRVPLIASRVYGEDPEEINWGIGLLVFKGRVKETKRDGIRGYTV